MRMLRAHQKHLSASLPWRTQLNKAVEYLRKGEGIDANAREKLEREIQWAELMMLFQKYSVADVNLRAALKYPDVIFKLIQHIFKQKEIMTQELERLRNGLKVAEVYNKVTGKLILDQVTIDRVYIDFVSAIGQDTEICDLCTALDSLQSAIASDQLSPLPSSLSNIIGTYVDSLIRRAEQTTCHKYADDVTRRMKNLEKAGSILMRYLMQDAEYARKYDCVRRMIRLQEGYQLMASISQLNDLRWRAVKLMKYIEKPSEMNETLVVNMPNIFHFASLLGLSELETGSILLEIFATDYQTLLRILNRICSSLPDADEIMLEKCLSSCETVLLRMHELSLLKTAIERETSSRNELQQLFDYLPDLLLTLGQIAVHSHTYHGSAMRMYKYTRILRMIVNQCLLGESDNATSATSAESVTSADNKNAKEERMVMGMSRRVGCYQLRQDGSIFERIPVLTAIGVCAASVVRESSKTDEELRNYWEEAFTSLAVHQQDMIEVTARVFASSLRCFTSEPCESPLKLSHAVRNICERALQLHPCDLVTVAAYILCLPPNTIDEFVQKLRRWVSGKRAPQTHINFLRTAQFVIYVSSQADNAKYIGALVESYWARSWAKRFGKMGVGVNMQLMMSKPASILEDLSRHCIDPHIVAEYVDKWSNKLEDFNHSMLTYAMHLIMKASSSADVGARHLALLSADGALRLLKKSENKENREFDALRTVLYVVSPYNYEVILFLVKWLSLFSFTQEENEFVFKIETLINHLHNIKRVDQVSRAECAWYVERSKALQTEKTARRPENEIYGCEMRALYERDDSTDLDGDSRLDGVSMFGSDPKANIYEREDVPLGSQPHEAVGRLPFHPFLYASLNKSEKFLVPIVEAEVTIDSLLLWQTTLRKLPCSRRCDRLARGHLLTIAVRKKGSHAAGSGKPLSKEDAATIHSLLETTTDRKAVIFCIAMCFKKLPLCEAKIQLLELGCNVASEWLTKKDALESPLDTTEVDNINDQCIRLREAIANYKTEFILRKYGLFDERTSEKLDKPAELIGHILTDCIDWQNAHDRKEKVDVTNQLSVVSNVDINSIYSTLIDAWLKDSDAMGVIDVDMNDTMGSMNGGATAALSPSDETDDAELFPLPIFDVSISRIVFLLQLIRDEKPNLLRHLVAPLMEQKRDGPVDPSKCKSYIRTACVLLMAFTENELAQAGMSLEDICVYILEKQAYIRLLDLSGLEMNVSQLLKLDKTIVVKNAINSLRSNATVLTVATCVLLDYNVADVQLIDNLLSKMIRFRKWKLAQALLLNCKQDYPSLCPHIKSLVLTWIRVFQSAIEDIESAESNMSDLSSSPVPSQTLLKWLFFLTSCPVEGGQSMRSLFGLLRARKCPVAASLVQITSDFSEKLSITLPVSDSGPVDFSFKWCVPCSTASAHTPTSSRSVQIEDVPMTDEEDI
ncbi:hypothetical protein WR25_06978 [Diploscapter pachys]|uniref:RZZ complex subunit KNTC1/ROD C-terminal domain-containing protein n=1 Tax=Diploscapter pachys TaxID=2018661 RepID=A0A2A2K3I4_9BILA|nr:hypothetical protein WR25_06978 [Diploscapter pachys]